MPSRTDGLARYGLACLLVALATALRLAADPLLGDRYPYAFHYLAVLLACWLCGSGPSVVALLLGGFAAEWFFVPPRGSVLTRDAAHALGSVLFVATTGSFVAAFEFVRRSRSAAEGHSRRLAASQETQRHDKRLYLSILNAMTEGVYACDPEGRPVLSNPALDAMLGHPGPSCRLEDALARLRPCRPDGGGPIEPADLPLARALRGDSGASCDLVVHPDGAGASRFLEAFASPLLDEEGRSHGVVAILRDVTAQRVADAEARATQERFQKFVDQIPILTWIKGADGRFLHVNSAYETLFRTQEEGLRGTTGRGLFPSEVVDRFETEDREVLASDRPLVTDEALAVGDGTVREFRTYKFPLPGSHGERCVAGAAVDVSEQRRAERALRESERRFRVFLDNLPAAAWVKDDTGRYVYTNARFDREFVPTLGPTVGRTDFDFWPRAEAEHLRSKDEAVLASRVPHDDEARLTPVGGSTRDWLTCTFPMEGPEGRTLVGGIGIDITARKSAELALAESESRYRALLDNSPTMIFVKDLDGKFLYVNKHTAATSRERPEDWVGRATEDVVSPATALMMRGIDRRVVETGRSETAEVPVEMHDGSRLVLLATLFPITDAAGRVTSVCGIGLDISARQATEAALAESEARFQAFMNHSPVLAWIKDEEGRFLYANRKFQESFGIREGWLEGKTDFDHWPKEVAERFRAQDREAREGGSSVDEVEHLTDGSGRTRHWWKTKFPIQIRPGTTLVGAVGVEITERVRAEEDLRRAEHRLRAIFEALADPLYLMDETGRFVDVNPSACAALGYTHEELLQRHVTDIDGHLTPAQIQGVQDSLRAAPGEVITFESVHVRADGSSFPVELRAVLIDWGGRGHFLSTTRDLTERRRVEARLRESIAFQESLLRAIPAPVYYKDETGRYLGGNDAFLRFKGWCPEQFVGKLDDEVATSPWGSSATAEDLGLLHDSGPRVYEGRVTDAGGRLRDVVFHTAAFAGGDGSNRGFISVMLDVTERRRAENEVRAFNVELERRVAERAAEVHSLARIIDASTDFIATATPDGKPLWENAAFRRVAGIPDGLHDRPGSISQLHPDDSSQRILGEGIPTAEREGHWVGETEVLAADGRVIPVSQLILSHREADGQILFVSTIMRDITERKRLESDLRERSEDLARANTELARASRLKDEFLASMSHELRTPLNAVLGLCQALGAGVYGPVSEQQAETVGEIERSGRHLLGLINDILDLSKVEAGQLRLSPATANLETLCQGSLRLVWQAAQAKRLKLSARVDPGIGPVIADELRLKQILVNLLSNAVKFTPAGGEVALEVGGDPAAKTLRFAVSDTGIGIRQEDMGILFQPFRQIDTRLSRHYAGTGLGLALVRKLAALHGGSVAVESVFGRGSCFTLTIPWVADRAAEAESQAAPPPEPLSRALEATVAAPVGPEPGTSSGLLVLLVEDDEVSASLTSDLLQAVGYRVARARDGLEAIRLAGELGPSVVLMDIQMPGMDGLEVIRRLRADPKARATRVIALTALAMAGDRERCLESGADAYLSKPFRLAELDREIKQLVGESDPGGSGRPTE